ncbi:hypothetical protein [Rhodococcus pyridinivorans]|uniref:hypothetical protein n=1 Tax=Rhodococcus pyridinivorans TaxID=103816 RepID=UPI00110F3620|nr:hypothetical protein [Rhodococcus pyridinivorans]
MFRKLAVTVFTALAIALGFAGPAAAHTTPVVGDPYSGCRFTPLALDCLLNAIPYFVSTGSAQMREELLGS